MRAVSFDANAFEDLAWWLERDRKVTIRILRLLQEAARDPFRGTGKPEPLKREFAGAWSRRIDHEHRLIYTVSDTAIRVLACRHHYQR